MKQVPTWQSETSQSHKRGQLVMIEGALITCGVCISYWIDLGKCGVPKFKKHDTFREEHDCDELM